jgi:putative MATE family efflux protein
MSFSSTDQKSGNFSRIAGFLKESLSSEHRDYTTGSLRRAVLLLAIPMVLETSLESVFALVDIFFVGRLGKESVATVGLTESVLTLVYSVAMGLSMAATAMVARRIGEKKPEAAAHAAMQSLLLSIGITVLMSLVGALLPSQILRVMGGSPATVAIGTPFTRIQFGFSIVIVLLFLINGIFRGAGNAAMAMWSLMVANACNIVLCPIMIHFYGLPGAAMATTIGRGIGVVYQLYHLFKGSPMLPKVRWSIRADLAVIRELFRVGLTGIGQLLINSASWIVLVRLIAQFHDEAISGYQVAIRVVIFFLLPAWGMSNATATLVGQNLGAGLPERAARSVRTAAILNSAFMAVVTLILFFASGPIVAILNKDPNIQAMAVLALRIISLGYVFYGVGMVLTSAFNGAGDTRTPTIINLFCFWGFQIPLAWLLANGLHLGPAGVFIAIPVSESTLTVVSFVVFRLGKWKKVRI